MNNPGLRSDLLEAALLYASWGWRVFPLHTPTGNEERPCSCGRPACDSVGKHPRITGWQQQATCDSAQVEKWWKMWPESNVGIATGEGSGIWALDVDGSQGGKTLAALEERHGMLPVTAEQITGGGGRHKLFAYTPGLGNRVGFAAGLDTRTDGGLIVAPPSLHQNGCYYMWDPAADPSEVGMGEAPEWLLGLIRSAAKPKPVTTDPGQPVVEGGRNAFLFSDACSMRRKGFDQESILAALRVHNQRRCSPPLAVEELEHIAFNAARYAPETVPTNGALAAAEAESFVVNVVPSLVVNTATQAPDTLEPEAYYGLPGQVVLAIAPHTESSEAAILASFLTGAGCLIGSGPYVYRDGARHTCNEYAALIGRTGHARKGTSSRRVNEVFLSLYDSNYYQTIIHDMHEGYRPTDFRELILRGLGSGEALVDILADEDEERRRVVFEEEFSRSLKVMRREGSTLSEILRCGWDGAPLEHRVRGRHRVARNTHICLLAHCTEAELKQQMTATEAFNGFANRILWFCTHRSKSLPFGGGDVPLAPIVSELHKTLRYVPEIGRVEMDDETMAVWGEGGIYDMLIDRPPGQLGAVTSRAEAHVTRLALLYAVLDAEKVIRLPHLLAALAVWDYCEASCRYLFGVSVGDEFADTILELLHEAYPRALTRTEIRDKFARNAPPGRIPKALDLLEAEGKAERSKAGEKGRPSELWRFRTVYDARPNDFNDKSPLQRARRLIEERDQ